MQLARFDIGHFLAHHWQKRPLLVRNPWHGWSNPIDPDELAGLACEAAVESRIIRRDGDHLIVEHGPFRDDRFDSLGPTAWTLLVQAVDQHVPDVAALLHSFRFVPDWRIDDVMVSFAADGGGVGPHYDQYDVFLVQGAGQRRWRIGPRCDAQTPLVPHDDLRLLPDFVATDEWVLEPGDILYVPPGVAHDGMAVGDGCMTYSIGFRAPSRADLLEGWSAARADLLSEDDRYVDPGLSVQDNPGEITHAALDMLHGLALDALTDRAGFARWFGGHATVPRSPEIDWRLDRPPSATTVTRSLAKAVPLRRNPASRYAFIQEGSTTLLFVDGELIACTDDAATAAQALCAHPAAVLDPALAASAAVQSLVVDLLARGVLAFDED